MGDLCHGEGATHTLLPDSANSYIKAVSRMETAAHIDFSLLASEKINDSHTSRQAQYHISKHTHLLKWLMMAEDETSVAPLKCPGSPCQSDEHSEPSKRQRIDVGPSFLPDRETMQTKGDTSSNEMSAADIFLAGASQNIEDSRGQKIDDVNVEDIAHARRNLKSHVEHTDENPRNTPVLFFLELTPFSANGGANCRGRCGRKIKERDYRIAVKPGSSDMNWTRSPDYYHVRCFEDLVDFSQDNYLKRLQPLNKETVVPRELSMASMMDGNHYLDSGAYRLVAQWKVMMSNLIKQRDGVPVVPKHPDLEHLLSNGGSARHAPVKPQGMPQDLFDKWNVHLAPVETDGPEDEEEWNLFHQYLAEDPDNPVYLQQSHLLNLALTSWKFDQRLAHLNDDRLTDEGKLMKKELGEKAIRAIKRLSVVFMEYTE